MLTIRFERTTFGNMAKLSRLNQRHFLGRKDGFGAKMAGEKQIVFRVSETSQLAKLRLRLTSN